MCGGEKMVEEFMLYKELIRGLERGVRRWLDRRGMCLIRRIDQRVGDW